MPAGGGSNRLFENRNVGLPQRHGGHRAVVGTLRQDATAHGQTGRLRSAKLSADGSRLAVIFKGDVLAA